MYIKRIFIIILFCALAGYGAAADYILNLGEEDEIDLTTLPTYDQVINNGTLTLITLTQAPLNNDITGDGDLIIQGNLTNTGGGAFSITQNNLTVLNTFDSTLLTNLDISGTLFNGGVLTLRDGGDIMAIDNLSATIKGNLTLNGGSFANSGNYITQEYLTIEQFTGFTTAAGLLDIENAIVNRGTLNFNAGNNANAVNNMGSLIFSGAGMQNNGVITGTGTMTVSGSMTNTASITQNAISVLAGGQFTTNANLLTITTDILNQGTITFNGGTNNTDIRGADGTLQISGAVINNASVTQNALQIIAGGDLTADLDDFTLTSVIIENDGILRLNGNYTLGKQIDFSSTRGSFYINGNINNNLNHMIIQNTIYVENGAAFSADLDYLDLTNGFNNAGTLTLDSTSNSNDNNIANTGTLTLNGDISSSGAITGAGNTTLTGAFTTSAAITQDNLTITNTGSLTMDAANLSIVSTLTNNNSLTLFGTGTMDYTLAGTGAFLVQGNITSSGNITQSGLNVASGAAFTADRAGLNIGAGGITLNGTLALTADADGVMSSAGALKLMAPNAVLDMQNDWADNLQFASLTADSGTAIKMDIFNNSSGIRGDSITTTGNIMVDGDLYVRAGVGVYENAVFNLIVSDATLAGWLVNDITAGTFALAHFEDNSGMGVDWVFNAGSNTIQIIINGINTSSFALLDGLSFNQMQIAKELDQISAAPQGDIEDVINNMVFASEDAQLDAMAQIAPHFLANILSPQYNSVQRGPLYQRVKEPCEDSSCPAISFWAQADNRSEFISSSDNSPGNYSFGATGAYFGADKFYAEYGVLAGFYGNYSTGTTEQGLSKADISSYGLGVYGGIIDEMWEFKALAGAGYQSYSSSRRILQPEALLDRTAKADFNAYTLNADMEILYKKPLNDTVYFKPYGGVNAAWLNYGNISEKGADSLNTNIDGANITAITARAGAGVGGGWGGFKWDIAGEYGRIIQGGERQITATLNTPGAQSVAIKGGDIGLNILGVKAGAALRLGKDWNIFAGGSYAVAGGYRETRMHAGISYSFCAAWLNAGAEKPEQDIVYYPTLQPAKPAAIANYIISDSLFEDRATIGPALQDYLAKTAAEISKEDYNTLTIIPYADSDGNTDDAADRAKAVAEYLAMQGISQRRIKTETAAAAPDMSTPEGFFKNKAVEIRLD